MVHLIGSRLLEDRRTIDVIISNCSFSVLKWWKNSRFLIIFYVNRRKIKYKTSCRGIEQVREEGNRKKAVSFY